MLSQRGMGADSPPLKRSFGDAVGHDPFPYLYHLEQNGRRTSTVKVADWGRCHTTPSPTKRRSISIHRSSTMPVQAGPPLQAAFPSFMSVFGSGVSQSDDKREDNYTRTAGRQQPGVVPSTSDFHTQSVVSVGTLLQHRASTTSLTSNSTESSPTTTNSTFDSPSVTDPSPSSSPESPTTTIPLSPFKSTEKPSEVSGKDVHSGWDGSTQPPMEGLVRAESPKGRNVKNLSLNTAASSVPRPATSSGIENGQGFATPFSPVREALRTGRRKPTNLTIQTPGPEQQNFVQTLTEIPPTPNSRPSLHHYQSSPALPSLLSPTTGPANGMHLPVPLSGHGSSRPNSQSSSILSLNSSLHDLKEEEDHYRPLKSQETQERGYPNGPVKIYDTGVYLYLEPTLEEASDFDTIINVAKEIKNPFDGLPPQDLQSRPSIWNAETDRSSIPEPQTAVSILSFKSAFEWPQTFEIGTPTTPKAGGNFQPRPEYIHVPWDHNSEIVEDLFPLCKIIDDRIAANKKVLIHCQLGVSRSASLVIAYGIYKGYKPDFHTMYAAVKDRSQWVGPNMSLIYQLMDFRSKVEKSGYAISLKEPKQEWFRLSNEHVQTPKPLGIPRVATEPDLFQKSPAPQVTNPVGWRTSQPPPINLNKKLPPVPLFHQDDSPKTEVPINKTESKNSLPPVAIATWSPHRVPTEVQPSVPPKEMSPSPPPRPLPLRELSEDIMEIPPHRPRELHLPPMQIAQPPTQMDLAMQDVPQTPSLFSPRATEFMASLFGRTDAGDLHAGSRTSILLMPGAFPRDVETAREKSSPAEVDPRSPPQPADHGAIMRSIDDFL